MSGWMFLAQQALSAACLLCALGRAASLGRIFPLRLAGASLLCALAALLSVMQPLLRLPALILALLTPLGAWPRIPRRLRLHLVCLHGVLALIMAGSARLMASSPLPRLMVLPLCWGMLLLLPQLMRRHTPVRCVSISIRHAAHRLTLTALVDSGNLLRDPLTSLPVIVISRRAAARLIPLPRPGEIQPGMRLMRIRTLTGTSLMTIFRPARICISSGGGWQEIRALIGLSPDGYEGFQALLPASLLSCLTPIILDKEELTP